MTLRQAVVFAILMGADMRDMAPVYVLEKAESCMMPVPEVLLDSNNRAKFQMYAKRWDMDWDTERDLKRPISEVLGE